MASFMHLILASSVLLVGLGCTPTRKASKPDTAALIEKVTQLSAASRTAALVSYAFLYAEKAPTRFLATRTAKKHKDAWSRLGPSTAFVSRPVESGLPMTLNTLSEGVSPALAPDVLKMKSVLLARYFGPKLPQDAHVIEFARLSHSCADTPSFVLDLSTRKIYAIADFEEAIQRPSDFLSQQVVPGIERAPNGTITFYTRGMVKFGLPDLEQTDIELPAAKNAFKSFQEILRRALAQTELNMGGQFGEFTLAECKRPKNAIEQSCVNLSLRAATPREN